MYNNKRIYEITLDLECYEDLEIENINWNELLQLEGDENVYCNIKEIEISY